MKRFKVSKTPESGIDGPRKMKSKPIKHLVVLVLLTGVALLATVWIHPQQKPPAPDEASLKNEIRQVRQEVKRLSSESLRLSKSLARFSKGRVIVVDTASNRLSLLSGSKVLLDAPCSTGSGLELDDPADGRKWLFKTPRGEFSILSKIRNPVWRKPDWAFIEEGNRPPGDVAARLEEGVLGDYALAFGNGYFIHGTLYTRFIGKNVTHGCIRLGDSDLERLFRQVPVGTPVVIF